MDTFSILIYDTEGGVWIERFEDTIERAKETANKLFYKVCKQF